MTTERRGSWKRRAVLVGTALGFVGPSLSKLARADVASAQQALKRVLGEIEPQEGKVTLDMPEIAENGNTVPLEVFVDSPMEKDNFVKAVHIVAEGNPQPEVISFQFTPMSGRAAASTRMRLAKTQNVIAVAEMSDGSLWRTAREVKVTIGGCGG